MRIGTWNLEGKWGAAQARLLGEQYCDVWLLTEVSEKLSLVPYHVHLTKGEMAPGRRWAAVVSKSPLSPFADPHPASAMALVGGILYCSSILPWRAALDGAVWSGEGHAAKTRRALETLLAALPDQGLVWGGDWNQALSGREFSGSEEGRKHLLKAVGRLGLTVPTAGLPHRLPPALSIDHIAVSIGTRVVSAEHVAVDPRLSDHDLYVVETA
jgi:enamine deaminase RidA (YjgF/YER057c/UK114 family)